MKILILTPYPPYPPHAGGRIRIWEQIRYLSRFHELTVVSFIFSDSEYEIESILADYCVESVMVRRYKPSPEERLNRPHLPRLIHEYETAEMSDALHRIGVNKFDVVLLEHIFMAQYGELFIQPVVLQEHNIESNVLKRFSELRRQPGKGIFDEDTHAVRAFDDAEEQWRLMVHYEDQMWSKFPLRITVSTVDKREMDLRCKVGKSIVIDNGVSTQRVVPIPSNYNSKKILFMGTLDYYPNVDSIFYFIEEIIPRIWRSDPDVSLLVAGRNPSPSIQQLARDSRVEVIANPENMSEVAKQCCLSIVPLRFGGGTRLKILESMAMGLPVVSTSVGCEGLSVMDGYHILIRDDSDQFADAVLGLITDPVQYNKLRINSRKLVEERYDWSTIFGRLQKELSSFTK